MSKSGKMDSVAVIGGSGVAQDVAIEDLETWEFLPALRSREPVDIDLIIEIPFGINQKAISPPAVPVLSGVDRSPRSTRQFEKISGAFCGVKRR